MLNYLGIILLVGFVVYAIWRGAKRIESLANSKAEAERGRQDK